MPSANGIAIYLCNHRLGNLADEPVQIAHLQARRATFVFVPAVTTDFLIAASTEIALLTGKHYHPNAVVVPGIGKRRDHFVNGTRAKGIEYVRAVDAHRCHPVLLGVDDIRILLCYVLFLW